MNYFIKDINSDSDTKDHNKPRSFRHTVDIYMLSIWACISHCVHLLFNSTSNIEKDVEAQKQEKIKEETKEEKSSRWTFWSIYINYGLNGSICNLLYLDPIALMLVLSEITINSINTYAMTKLTSDITGLIKKNESANPNSPIGSNGNMYILIFVVLLIIVTFSMDFSNLLRRLGRKKSRIYKNRIVESINTAIIDYIRSCSHELDKEHNANDQSDALSNFIWVYSSITELLVDICVQSVRSIIFCCYIVYCDPRLIFLLIMVYYTAWKYLVPYLSEKKKKTNDNNLWEFAYYELQTLHSNKVNSLYDQMYCKKDNNNDHDQEATTDFEIRTLKQEFEHNFDQSEQKLRKPNLPQRYTDIINYYAAKNDNWQESYDLMSFSQNMVIFLLIAVLFYQEQYQTMIVILFNRHAVFGVIRSYSDMKRTEVNSARSLNKVTKILDAIDEEKEKLKNISFHQIISNEPPSLRNRIKSIDIEGMTIEIPKPVTNNNDNEDDHEENNIVTKARSIYLQSVHIEYQPGKVIVLDGPTSCGKSLTINAFAGLYNEPISQNMQVNLSNGQSIKAEFNNILNSRCYVNQNIVEQFKYNNKIVQPMFKLFPNAKSIEEIREFLITVFDIKPTSIPEKLEDHPHPKLCGGEIQRYAVATQVWRARNIQPDCMILDEVDRALDAETAIKMLSWIIKNLNCFFVIVTHLSEVKSMLIERKHVSQIWRYDSSNSDQIKIVPEIIQ